MLWQKSISGGHHWQEGFRAVWLRGAACGEEGKMWVLSSRLGCSHSLYRQAFELFLQTGDEGAGVRRRPERLLWRPVAPS